MSGLSGVNQFADFARAARLAGDEFLPKVRKEIAKVGPPAKKAVRASAEAKMPKRGGYAAVLGRAIRVRVNTDTGFTTAGVTIVTYATGQTQRRDIPAINQGRLRKKVWGNPQRWVTQRVPAGFWDDAMDVVSDDAEQRIRDVMAQTIDTLKG